MRLVKLITACKRRWMSLAAALLFISVSANAQENSPYSRYGIGDLTPNQNILNRGMGGISAAYTDFQSLNFINPASYGNISSTIFDIGAETDARTLKSKVPAKKFTNTNALISYLQLGVPIASKRMIRDSIYMGLTFGLRPYSRINYKIFRSERLLLAPGVSDSLTTLFEGNGGTNQAYTGLGIRIKNFSAGVNVGYIFGNKDISTRLIFVNDTVEYYRSNSANVASYGGLMLNGGLQYEKRLNKKALLRIGLYGNLQRSLNASQDVIRETYTFDPNSTNNLRIDSIYEDKNVSGKVVLPASLGGGVTYQSYNWLIGADFETTNWASYRFYGQKDFVRNNWTFRVGAQFFPAKENTSAKKYFQFVKYRAGFYYGPNYINPGNSKLPEYAATFGAGFPLTSLRRVSFGGEFVTLNTAVELGSRGSSSNNLREGITRISIGISMNARWFQKRKYD